MPLNDSSAHYYTYIGYVDDEDNEKVDFILLPYVIIEKRYPLDEILAFVGPRFPYPFELADPYSQITKEEQLDTECGVWKYNVGVDEFLFETHQSHFVRTFDAQKD